MNTTKITLPDGKVLSIESDDAAGVPDTTTDAGANCFEREEKLTKDANSDGAEYDAADAVSEVTDVEKANESTFFGLMLARRAQEGFGLKRAKSGYASPKAFFSSPECKTAIEEAKKYASKHNLTISTKQEIQNNKASFKAKLFNKDHDTVSKTFDNGQYFQQDGAVFYTWMHRGRSSLNAVDGLKGNHSIAKKAIWDGRWLSIIICFTKKNGSVTFKKFAEIQLTADKGLESTLSAPGQKSIESAMADYDLAFESFMALESDDLIEDDGIDIAAELEDTPEANATTDATDTPPATDDTGAATNSSDTDGDGNCDNCGAAVDKNGAATDTPPATDDAGAATDTPPATDDEAKAVENFFSQWGL